MVLEVNPYQHNSQGAAQSEKTGLQLAHFIKFGHSGTKVRTFRRNSWTPLHKKIKIIV